jgi:hypothetical protein
MRFLLWNVTRLAAEWFRSAGRSGLLGIVVLLLGPSAGSSAEPSPFFRNQIAPLLRARCLRCHGGEHPKGDLDLTTRKNVLEGGAGGAVLKPGQATASRLYVYVRDRKMPPKKPLAAAEVELLRRWIDAGAPWEGPALTMPRRVVGRAGKDWWSLQPIKRSALPRVSNPAWVRNPLDAFILARLDAARLRPSPEVERRAYIRRVTVDLLGLLPTPEEVEAFVNDRSPNAYEKLVDRLLGSPHYGERWARHWLDVVRFAESHGYEMNTLRANAWPYRDYVIDAFNQDKPYPRFVLEQLAGDAVARGDPKIEAATGFLVGGTHDMVGNATKEGQLQQRMDDLYDMVSTTGSAFLGLTVNCARCHDHKFDPILQKDYYGLQAIFSGVQHTERPIGAANIPSRQKEAARLRQELSRLNEQIDDCEPLAGIAGSPVRRPAVHPRRNVERFSAVQARYVRFVISATTDGTEPCIDELEIYSTGARPSNLALAGAGARASASSVFPKNPLHKIEHVNDGQVGNSRSWISREPGKGWVMIELPRPARISRVVWGRDREEKFTDRLPRDYRVEVSLDRKTWKAIAGSWDRLAYAQGREKSASTALPTKLQQLLEERANLETRLAGLLKPPMIYAGTFKAPEPTFVLKRGDPLQPLARADPSAIRAVGRPLGLGDKARDRQRRIALARWIADPHNPLPARVTVNRLWHYHFGQGIVRTPSDFGYNGDRPSHPELLDWLAAEFQSNGWRLKPLHKLIILSSTYRQASGVNSAARKVDAGCRLLWRYPPRRLETEALRDAILQVSGSLNLRMGGPGYHLWKYSGYVIVFEPRTRLGPEEFRRMVYQFKPRTQQDETFGVFDCPDATLAMPRRNVSTTALQALNLLNGAFVQDQSKRFAARLRREAGTDPARQVERAIGLVFGRNPSASEARAATALVQEHGFPVFCRALYNANELMYLE